MPLPTITDAWYCQYKYTLAGAQFAENTFTVHGTVTDDQELATNLGDIWVTHMAPVLCETLELTQVSVQLLDGSSAAFVQDRSESGEVITDMAPDNVAVVSTLRTALAGRSFRGRMYWPGIPIAGVSSDSYTLETTFRDSFTSAVQAWRAAMATISEPVVLQVLSRTLGSDEPTTAITVNPRVCTQRRRLTGGLG